MAAQHYSGADPFKPRLADDPTGLLLTEATLAVHEMRLAAKFIGAMLPADHCDVVTDALQDIANRLESAVVRVDREIDRSR